MDDVYHAGGWTCRSSRKPKSRDSELKLLPFSSCQNEIKATYGRVKHNLACATVEEGEFTRVVISTIFYFSIFDIDRVF